MYTILVVDDTPENLAVLHDSLDEEGYFVLIATNGDAAYKIVYQQEVDLILLDAVMPGINGFDLAKKLKSDPYTNNIPIVFMTGLTETESIVKAFNNGVIDYVTKPLNPKEVLVRISSHIKTSKANNLVKDLLDEVNMASISINFSSKNINWITNHAKKLLETYLSTSERDWVLSLFIFFETNKTLLNQIDIPIILSEKNGGKLYLQIRDIKKNNNEIVISLREENEALVLGSLQNDFMLTFREAEVLLWLTKGKTNREIGLILGNSPRTIDKHVEHIFEKIGAENRNSAINLVLNNKNIKGSLF
ncbi:response regulator [Ferrovum sp. PN-J185]|uniref:response regulator n=1 Tax=Ferrovum sp. PN-J185 TaxID=1356306 RepID=UPI0007942593|nr:response regulator [Ferrovum sp. PN-J185]KXW56928.1 response regulator PleD [Ferrovum sp. PN-J185]MCC6069199.1 response regulator [Ferrovum sp. PN-J185]